MSTATMQGTTARAEDEEHGIESAVYALAPIGRNGEYRPSMSCFCGFSTGNDADGRWIGSNDTWEETGQEFDVHLAGTIA